MDTAPKNNVQEGKAKVSLLPMDILIKYLVPAYEEGVTKYARESWRQGFHTSVMVDAALRHINEFFWEGQDIDPDSSVGKHHLAGAIFSLLSILHTLDTKPELDDRVKTIDHRLDYLSEVLRKKTLDKNRIFDDPSADKWTFSSCNSPQVIDEIPYRLSDEKLYTFGDVCLKKEQPKVNPTNVETKIGVAK